MAADETFCGIVLRGDADTPCGVAFLSDEITTYSETDDRQILELIEEAKPSIIAFSAPLNGPKMEKGFRDGEEDLIDEGHSFLPTSMEDKAKLERAVFLKNSMKRLSFHPEFIECRPRVSADILEIRDDDDLEQFGVRTSDISSMTEFEAVIAAITAKFYAQDQFEEKGFIVPKKV